MNTPADHLPTRATPEEVWFYFRERLTYIGESDPIAVLNEASAFREQLAPYLVSTLETLAADPTPAQEQDYALHLHALVLLAEWRDERAYRPAVAFSRQPKARAEILFGDFAGELLNRCLASVFDGDMHVLVTLAEDDEVSEWLRLVALDALSICAVNGDADEQEVARHVLVSAERVAAELRAKPNRRRGDNGLLACHAGTLADLGAMVYLPIVRGWYVEGLIDAYFEPLEDLEFDMDLSRAQRATRMNEVGRGYIDSAAEAMLGLWGDDNDVIGEPYVRETPKIGRNDPCPCGSGKKFKKCCGTAL